MLNALAVVVVLQHSCREKHSGRSGPVYNESYSPSLEIHVAHDHDKLKKRSGRLVRIPVALSVRPDSDKREGGHFFNCEALSCFNSSSVIGSARSNNQ